MKQTGTQTERHKKTDLNTGGRQADRKRDRQTGRETDEKRERTKIETQRCRVRQKGVGGSGMEGGGGSSLLADRQVFTQAVLLMSSRVVTFLFDQR